MNPLRKIIVGTAVAAASLVSGMHAADALVNCGCSPNAKPIVFSSYRNGDMDIYSQMPGSSQATRLTSAPGYDGEPSISADGTKIAFTSARGGLGGGRNEIYVMNANGSNPQMVVSDPNYMLYRPSLSPDGTKIAFSYNNWWFDTPKIGMKTLGIPGYTQLTNPATDKASFQPAWSPDGQRIAFVSDRDGTRNVWWMNATGGRAQKVTSDGGTDPAWSPDGQKIAYTFVVPGTNDAEVFWTNAFTPNIVTRVTNRVGFDGDPTWSPDGSSIGYTSNVGGVDTLYVAGTYGSSPRPITSGGYASREANWGYPIVTPARSY